MTPNTRLVFWGSLTGAALIVLLTVLLGCVPEPVLPPPVPSVSAAPAWEYKVVYATAGGNHERTGANALAVNDIVVEETVLNNLGKDNWEMVSSFLELETSFPNLADPKYTTGIHPNVRPKRLGLVFKRPASAALATGAK